MASVASLAARFDSGNKSKSKNLVTQLPLNILTKDDWEKWTGISLDPTPDTGRSIAPKPSPHRLGVPAFSNTPYTTTQASHSRSLSPVDISGLSSFPKLCIEDPPSPLAPYSSNVSQSTLLGVPPVYPPPHIISPYKSTSTQALPYKGIYAPPPTAAQHPASAPYPPSAKGPSAVNYSSYPPAPTHDSGVGAVKSPAKITKPKARAPVPPPVNTRVAAALPGPQCNVRIIQPDNKLPKFRVGEFVQVRRWHKTSETFGPWSYGYVFEKVKSKVIATGHKETFYIVDDGDKLNQRLYAAHLGEIATYNPADVMPPIAPEPLVHGRKPTNKPSSAKSNHKTVVYALVKTPNAKDPQRGILTPAYLAASEMEPWKVRLIAGPFRGCERQAFMTMPYNPDEVASAVRAGLEVMGDGTPAFLRSCGIAA